MDQVETETLRIILTDYWHKIAYSQFKNLIESIKIIKLLLKKANVKKPTAFDIVQIFEKLKKTLKSLKQKRHLIQSTCLECFNRVAKNQSSNNQY